MGTIALLVVCKGLAWAISLGSARGGPTFPAIFLGIAGGLLALHLPGFSETPAGVLVGATVVSVLQLPFSIIIALLVTQAGAGVVPLIIVGVVVAYIATAVLAARRTPAAAGSEANRSYSPPDQAREREGTTARRTTRVRLDQRSAEAARSGGRRWALRQRSSAVQDQVTRRREELERSRHLGLLLLVRRRFKAIEGGDLSVLISLSLFVAMVPLVPLGFSWLTGFSSSANLASFVIRHYGLHEPVAGIVRDFRQRQCRPELLNGARGPQLGGGRVPLAVSVQKTFAEPGGCRCSLMASYLRGGLWFLLYVATQSGVEAATWTLGATWARGAGRPGRGGAHLRAVAGHPASAARQRPGRLARPGPHRIAGTVVTVGLRLLSLLLLPRWLASWAIPFGAIGTSIALLLVVQLLATGWVVVAAFGAVYWERIADQDTVIRTELDS